METQVFLSNLNAHSESWENLSSQDMTDQTYEVVIEKWANAIDSNTDYLKYLDEEIYDQEKINIFKAETAKFLAHLQI